MYCVAVCSKTFPHLGMEGRFLTLRFRQVSDSVKTDSDNNSDRADFLLKGPIICHNVSDRYEIHGNYCSISKADSDRGNLLILPIPIPLFLFKMFSHPPLTTKMAYSDRVHMHSDLTKIYPSWGGGGGGGIKK